MLASGLGLVALVVLIFLGVRIAFAGALVGFVGLWLVSGLKPAVSTIGILPYSETANYAFIVLPLFILMGEIASAAGFINEAFRIGRLWVGWLPGGLASATVIAGAILASVCGSGMAATSILAKTALPELEKAGYDKALSSGCVAAAATLSPVIPPSSMLVVYGIITEQSIGKLLIGGFVPGILIALLFILQVTLQVWRTPSAAPSIYEHIAWKERAVSLAWLGPTLFIAVIIIGGIYFGVFSPTQAGAAGAGAAILAALAVRKINWAKLWQSMLETGHSTSSIFIMIVGIFIFVRFLTVTRGSYEIAEFIVGLQVSPLVILMAMLAFYFILGMFLPAISMMLLTLPVFFPVVRALGYDPIWFGVVIVIMCEVGALTPPVGFYVFVLNAIAPHIPITVMYRGVMPFFITQCVVVALLVAFPQIVLFLPSRMV